MNAGDVAVAVRALKARKAAKHARTTASVLAQEVNWTLPHAQAVLLESARYKDVAYFLIGVCPRCGEYRDLTSKFGAEKFVKLRCLHCERKVEFSEDATFIEFEYVGESTLEAGGDTSPPRIASERTAGDSIAAARRNDPRALELLFTTPAGMKLQVSCAPTDLEKGPVREIIGEMMPTKPTKPTKLQQATPLLKLVLLVATLFSVGLLVAGGYAMWMRAGGVTELEIADVHLSTTSVVVVAWVLAVVLLRGVFGRLFQFLGRADNV